MRRRRGLSDDELRLWVGVAKQTKPMPGKDLPDLPPLEAAPVVAPPAPRPRASAKNVRLPAAKPVPVAPPKPSLMPAYQAPPVKAKAVRALPGLFPIEKPVKRKIAKGRVEIDDRIDLHDKTQIVAHYALLGFLRQAQANHLRHVLVITGRGASFGSRGVIKRSLPHWFDTPEFRSLVAGFEPADRSHGGDGAFYIRIRRR